MSDQPPIPRLPSVFPWSNTYGLCRALDDAALWSWVISEENLTNARYARKSIKLLCKRHRLRSPSGVPLCIAVDDDLSFGYALVELMRAPHGRADLMCEFRESSSFTDVEWHFFRKIYTYATREIGGVPSLAVIFDRHGEESSLAPERLAAWLQEQSDLSEEDVHGLALVGSALAIVIPDAAQDIFQIFVGRDQRLEAWFGESVRVVPRRKKRRNRPTSHTLAPSHPAVPAGGNDTGLLAGPTSCWSWNPCPCLRKGD